MTEYALNRHDLEVKIIKRCWENEEFRKEFTAAPEATFMKYLELPAGSLPKITVHDEGQGDWHIVLPEKPADVRELSDAELEKVAGGGDPLYTSTIFQSTLTVVSITETQKGW
jgi:hypothetical protein